MTWAPWLCFRAIPSKYVYPIVNVLNLSRFVRWPWMLGHEATDCFLYKLYLLIAVYSYYNNITPIAESLEYCMIQLLVSGVRLAGRMIV